MSDIKLNKVEIRGFKSIKSATVNFHDMNVLIGINGSGKTNLIQSLSLLQNILEKNLRSFIGNIGGSSSIYGGIGMTKSVEMIFSFDNGVYRFELTFDDEGNPVFEQEYHRTACDGWSVAETSYNESRFEEEFFNCIDFSANPVSEAKHWFVYGFNDTSVVRQGGLLSDVVFLHHDASNLAPFLYMLKESHVDSYKDIIRVIRMAVPYFSDFILQQDFENAEMIHLRWKRAGSDKVLEADTLSDGTVRFICFVTLLLEPSELQPSMIIMDGPEQGLHPYAITMLAELIHTVRFKNKKQFLISTHSADLLDCFEAEDVIVAEPTSDGSEYTRLSGDDLKEWLEDYSLGTLWKKNILGGQP